MNNKHGYKALALLIASILILFAACGSSGGSGSGAQTTAQAATEAATTTTAATTTAATTTTEAAKSQADPLKVMVRKSPNVIDFETNEYCLWLLEQTKVSVVWEQIPSESAADKIPVVMMSNDLPDAFLGFNFNQNSQVQYGMLEKIIIPLNDLIEKFGVETKRMFAEQMGTESIIKLADGNIYAIPTYSDILHVNYAQKCLINTTFLDKLNMEMPNTTEDFYAYLKAVKENDPNGNNQADEIPLIGDTNGWHHDIFPYLTEPFIFDDGMYGRKVEVDANGKLSSILDKDGYRDALKYIRRLYAEGLIYEGALSMKADQYKLIGENADAMILGAAMGAGNGDITEVGGERYKQYRAIPPLEGPTGLKQTPWFRYANVRQGAYALTKACKQQETAFKFGDFMLSYEATMRLRMGVKGVDWKDAEPGEKTIDGRPAIWNRINPYTGEATNQHLSNDGMFYETRGMFLDDCVVEPGTDIMEGILSQFLLAIETEEKYVQYGKEVFPPVSIPKDNADEFASLEVELSTFYKQARASFVTGEMDIDKDWDTYVNNLNSIGLKKYVEILQAAYDQASIKIGA